MKIFFMVAFFLFLFGLAIKPCLARDAHIVQFNGKEYYFTEISLNFTGIFIRISDYGVINAEDELKDLLETNVLFSDMVSINFIKTDFNRYPRFAKIKLKSGKIITGYTSFWEFSSVAGKWNGLLTRVYWNNIKSVEFR